MTKSKMCKSFQKNIKKCIGAQGYAHIEDCKGYDTKCIMYEKPLPIPEQYKKEAEGLIYEIGKRADKLWAFVTELGDSLEIKTDKCSVVISNKD